MPPIFSTATIARFEADAEANFNYERPCIVDRIGLAIVAGTAEYTLPSYVNDIRRITISGIPVYPLPHRELRFSCLNSTQQGRPYWYIINNIGQNKIRFFPVPNTNLADTTTLTSLWGSGITNNCIIEFYRQPDQSTNILPIFIRRRLLKCYINKRCFEVDKKGNSLKNVKYWADKYDNLKSIYSDLLDDLNNKPRKLIASNTSNMNPALASPVLPYRYGISVAD